MMVSFTVNDGPTVVQNSGWWHKAGGSMRMSGTPSIGAKWSAPSVVGCVGFGRADEQGQHERDHPRAAPAGRSGSLGRLQHRVRLGFLWGDDPPYPPERFVYLGWGR